MIPIPTGEINDDSDTLADRTIANPHTTNRGFERVALNLIAMANHIQNACMSSAACSGHEAYTQ
jgi:hypothetical protein